MKRSHLGRTTKRVRRASPADVAKEELLRCLARGGSIAEACMAAGKTGNSSFYYYWRRRDPIFAERADRILATPFHKNRIAAAQLPRPVLEELGIGVPTEVVGDPFSIFLQEYEKSIDRVHAADTAGLHITQIAAAADPDSELHDADFARRLREIEMRHVWRVEDNAIRQAVMDGNAQMVRWLIDRGGSRVGQGTKSLRSPVGSQNFFFLGDQSGEWVTAHLGKLLRGPAAGERGAVPDAGAGHGALGGAQGALALPAGDDQAGENGAAPPDDGAR